jgi:hypothetical protein
MNVIEVNKTEARSWMERWLGAGHFVSEAVLGNTPFDRGKFQTCIADDATLPALARFAAGGIVNVREAEVWLAETLDELATRGAKCVVVEDDLSNPTDPDLATDPVPTAFINDHVFSWGDLKPGKKAVTKEVMRVGSGYPRNAFVTTRSAAELGFIHGRQAPEKFPQQVAESLLAVIVSIFDDESYLVWTPES